MKFFDKIKSKIKQIQEKPEKEKARIVWILAVMIFALITALWLGFSKGYKIESGSKSDSFTKIIKEFKSNIENKIKPRLEIYL
ncbi:hypothetical protein KJ695_01705 [Patescibacteria group bacterium]|nr:hypothetical protein [Patescibacteria group bacterium]MBU4056607.1 hypothetical protein [Patescibacteria group bacterium]